MAGAVCDCEGRSCFREGTGGVSVTDPHGDQSLAARADWSVAQSGCSAHNGVSLASADRTPAGQKERQVPRPAPGCDRHYLRTSPQRAKFGIGDKDGGGSHQTGCSERDLIADFYFAIAPRREALFMKQCTLADAEEASCHRAYGRCPPDR